MIEPNPAADEIEDLRSANKFLHGLITNRDAEIERLRAALRETAIFLEGPAAIFQQMWSSSEKECDELRAEIERLRARAVKLESHIVNEGLWDKFVEKFGDEEDIRAWRGRDERA